MDTAEPILPSAHNIEFEEKVDRRVDLRSDQARRGGAGPVLTKARSFRSRSTWMGVLVALVLGGGASLTVTSNHSQPPHIGISTTTRLGTPFGGPNFLAADSMVTDRQWQEREAAFQDFRAKGPVVLDRLPLTQGLDYLGKSITDPGLKSELSHGIQNQKVEMVAIGFYDDCAEDGDVVRVQAAGVDVTIPLFHQVQYVEIPVLKGQQVQVTVSGVRDGTGGITLGMVTPAGTVHMPRLAPGSITTFMAR